MSKSRPYADHRRRFLDLLREQDAAAVIFTATEKTRNHDAEYRFRPDSDFWYLTGFREPDCCLLLLPDREEGESVLFLRRRVPEEEVWTGLRLGVERASEVLGVDEARPIEKLWDDLPELLKGYRDIVYALGRDEGRDRKMMDAAKVLRRQARGGVQPPLEWIDPLETLHELRLFKTESELEIMRRAAAVTTEAHTAAMAETAPGVNEAAIDGLLEYTFRRRGGTGAAYTNIVAGGANACILHYIENDRPLKAGDLLLIDAGCEMDFYASDVTRTFPVDGHFSAEQRALYQVVLDAQKQAIEHVRKGVTFESVHDVATRALCAGLVELGLVQGSVDEVVESGSYRRFYMHRTGHWLGLDVHDQGRYHLAGQSRKLQPGMVLTVEPGLYVAPDDETVEARWRGIGIRIEDDILVTESGYENLTAAIPKEIEDVEAACAGTGNLAAV
ncbi:aminopeptidase P N-terminal domain-containing protein [Engelhardtia mirabilis]|uniref:Xaa-Pro aminopeptidase n=1 Tax=Engelhardtia mirabilis TaxID=2528011 RepID=A0A518BM61_9BACT|nr:Xaa-Pro aminopeptidase [Planctomycetes bacterium Pla133]QDV02395.1 Xaa-Pro aminopeptidase [Planctomycetes bacterium Pla86]